MGDNTQGPKNPQSKFEFGGKIGVVKRTGTYNNS